MTGFTGVFIDSETGAITHIRLITEGMEVKALQYVENGWKTPKGLLAGR